MRKSVVQVNLDFSPPSAAVFCEHSDQTLVVLLSGIEVCMNHGSAVVIAEVINNFGIFACPPFEAAVLLGAGDALLAVRGIDGRLEMVGHRKDHMARTARGRFQSARDGARKDFFCVGELFCQTHSGFMPSLTFVPPDVRGTPVAPRLVIIILPVFVHGQLWRSPRRACPPSPLPHTI